MRYMPPYWEIRTIYRCTAHFNVRCSCGLYKLGDLLHCCNNVYRCDFKLGDKGLFAAWFLERIISSIIPRSWQCLLLTVWDLCFRCLGKSLICSTFKQLYIHHTYLSLYCVCAILLDGAKGSQKLWVLQDWSDDKVSDYFQQLGGVGKAPHNRNAKISLLFPHFGALERHLWSRTWHWNYNNRTLDP